MNYRKAARKSVERARVDLSGESDRPFYYAALELRMALEALIYERAELYKNEIPEKKFRTWQPRQILDLLLAIDPYADKSSSWSFCQEDDNGAPLGEIKPLGKERVISLKEVKFYYARLGSYLHTPTTHQLKNNKVADSKKVQKRCIELVQILEQTLSSPVFNCNFGSFARIDCERCDGIVARRMASDTSEQDAQCPKCGAPYTVTPAEDGKVIWRPGVQSIKCLGQGCVATTQFWNDQLRPGITWICSECTFEHILALSVAPLSDCENGHA